MIKRVGESLLVLGASITMLLTTPSATETQVEVAETMWEEIEVTAENEAEEVEQGEVFARTHDVKINEFTYDEAQLLLKVAQAEAGNQGEDGMWLVMSVIFNRRVKDAWPATITEVVYQESQFSTVTNGSIDQVEILAEAHCALARIERGEVAPQIIAFETVNSNVLDQYFTEVFTYQDHKFYVEKEQE